MRRSILYLASARFVIAVPLLRLRGEERALLCQTDRSASPTDRPPARPGSHGCVKQQARPRRDRARWRGCIGGGRWCQIWDRAGRAFEPLVLNGSERTIPRRGAAKWKLPRSRCNPPTASTNNLRQFRISGVSKRAKSPPDKMRATKAIETQFTSRCPSAVTASRSDFWTPRRRRSTGPRPFFCSSRQAARPPWSDATRGVRP